MFTERQYTMGNQKKTHSSLISGHCDPKTDDLENLHRSLTLNFISLSNVQCRVD